MKNLKKLLLAAVLVGAAIGFAPPKAEANIWCDICNQSYDCFACCRCAGVNGVQCAMECD